MSLATRCTACGTIFRVVQDQLKVSEGWVRCGRCQEVFNALEGLFDLEREAPPQRPPPRAAEAPATAEVPTSSSSDDWDSTQAQQRSVDPIEDEELPATSESDVLDSRFLRREVEADFYDVEPEFADAQFPSELLQGEHHEHPTEAGGLEKDVQPRRIRGSKSRSRTKKLDTSPAPLGAPQFVRSAERALRWRQPWVRGVLAVVVVILLAALAAQMAYQWRDLLAAERPETRPYLAQLCEYTGCQLEAPRRIDDLAVESSTLVKANGSDTYRLTVVLRNRGHLPLALPAIDLRLTDANGALLARRALSAGDFQARESVLNADSESTLQALLTTSGQRVAGYTVEIFYP